MDLLELTAIELAAKIKNKEVKVADALRAVFEQIESKEQEVHSFVTIEKERAFQKAEVIQSRIDVGEQMGMFAGVPVAVKDNMCVKGMRTTCSSKILSNFYPTYDADAVSRLEAADAIILGKTNMDEFAMIFWRISCSSGSKGMFFFIGF